MGIFLVACSDSKRKSDFSKDPVRAEQFWRSRAPLSKRLEDRVQFAPTELVDYLQRVGASWGSRTRPSIALNPGDQWADVRKAISELPPGIYRAAEELVDGIFLVRGLGSSGLSDWLFDGAGVRSRGFIVLDEENLNRRANEWMTWKENLPFYAQPGWAELTAEIEGPSNNDRVHAFQYVLLHELGHLVGESQGLYPRYNPKLERVDDPQLFPFSALSWFLRGRDCLSYSDFRFQERQWISYYAGEDYQLPITDAARIYDRLKGTSFPTLYAATDPSDDFADSFVSYVHSVLMHRRWRVTIQDYRAALHFELCWNEDRCLKKRAILEAVLKAYELNGGRRPASGK